MVARNESGQSILEFIIVLPLLVGLTVMLIKVNTAVQSSIVNQKYARSHALWLAFNSSEFPQTRIRNAQLAAKFYNKYVLGISENAAPTDSGETYAPQVVKMKIVPGPASASDSGDSLNQQEPDQRSVVRVRTSVSICTQSNFVTIGGQKTMLLPDTLKEGFNPSGFEYCRSPLDG